MNEIIEVFYDELLEAGQGAVVPQELTAALTRISRVIDEKLFAGSLTCLDLGAYEEAAQHRGFYAGFLSGMELLRRAGSQARADVLHAGGR